MEGTSRRGKGREGQRWKLPAGERKEEKDEAASFSPEACWKL